MSSTGNGRVRRLAGRIKQIVASYLEMHVKDPRLGMVTITDVRVTGDLHDATIFYTVFGSDDDRLATAAATSPPRRSRHPDARFTRAASIRRRMPPAR